MSDFTKKIIYGTLFVLGLLMVLSEVFFQFPSRGDSTIVGVMMGLGSGMGAVGIANLIMLRMYAKNPKLLKQKTIKVNDERNKVVMSTAKEKVYNLFSVLWWIVVLGLILARVDFWITGLLMVVIAMRTILLIYFANRVSNEI